MEAKQRGEYKADQQRSEILPTQFGTLYPAVVNVENINGRRVGFIQEQNLRRIERRFNATTSDEAKFLSSSSRIRGGTVTLPIERWRGVLLQRVIQRLGRAH
jgi:hypothetical protein